MKLLLNQNLSRNPSSKFEMKVVISIALVLTLLGATANAQKAGKPSCSAEIRPITEAAQKGHLYTIERYLAEGKNINICEWEGWTPLMAAVTFGQVESVRLLLANGADSSVRLENGQTVLIQAAQSEKTDPIVAELIKAGADLNASTNKGLTPLMRFAWMAQPGAVNLMLEGGADITKRDKDGWTAFRFGIYGGSAEVVKALVKYQADINEKDADGNTPLSWYSPYDTTEILEVLIAAKAKVNARNKLGETPLMNSAERFYKKEVELLINSGSDVGAVDKKGWNALMHTAASIYRRDEVGGHGDGSVRWLSAVSLIDLLIDKGTYVNAVNKQGETALILAVKAGNAHFAHRLLSRGADFKIKTKKGLQAKDYLTKIPKFQRDELSKRLGVDSR